MNRETSFTLAERDLLVAGRRYVFSSLSERRTLVRLILVWIGAVLACLAMFHFLGTGRMELSTSVGIAMVIATLGAFVVPAAVPLLTLPIVTKRRFKQDAMLRKPLTVRWSETHYRVETDDTTNNLLWTDYAKWREDEKQFLFFLSDYNYQILPKRALTPEQVADIRAVVTAARA